MTTTLRDIAPSAKFSENSVTLSIDDFKRLIAPLLSVVRVDEVFYLDRYPDVAQAIKSGELKSAREHFLLAGFFEGRFPSAPYVDERWYLETYPDVAEGVRQGIHKSARDHYIGSGHYEGRLPVKPV